VMTPSMFPEPFCLVAVESQLCGTPVLSTDWGAFTETIENKRTGYRCSTINDFVAAAKIADRLDRKYIRARAIRNYGTKSIAPQYQRFFERLEEIYPDHFVR